MTTEELLRDYISYHYVEGNITNEQRVKMEFAASDYLQKLKQLHIPDVVGQSEHLKAFKQRDTLFLDNTLKVEVITPESSVLVKDSRDNKLMWVEKGRLKRY